MALQESSGLDTGMGLAQGQGLALPPEQARERALQLAAQSQQAKTARTSQGSQVLGTGLGALGAVIGAFAGNPMLGYSVGSAAGKGIAHLTGNDPKGAADSFVSAVTGGSDLAKAFSKNKKPAPGSTGGEVTAPSDFQLGPELGTMTKEGI